MEPGSVVIKTDKGEQEVAKRSGALSLAQRRLLILADGKRSAADIGRMVAAGNYLEILDHLAREGFVRAVESAPAPAPAPAAGPSATPAGRSEAFANPQAQEFMLNALGSFARSVRNEELRRQIANAATQEELRLQLESWYDAIAENPDGLPVVDGLRAQLLKLFMQGGGRG